MLNTHPPAPLFQRESAAQISEEIVPLLKLHYDEIAHFKDIPLDPDYDQYQTIENAGALRVFTARDAEKTLIGYSVFFVRRNIHYKSSLQASQDIIFIHPKKRGFGKAFIQWCDEQLKAEGVEVAYQHVKSKHNFGPLLETLGYELMDLIYARRFRG